MVTCLSDHQLTTRVCESIHAGPSPSPTRPRLRPINPLHGRGVLSEYHLYGEYRRGPGGSVEGLTGGMAEGFGRGF
eukprot:1368580-Amorphochlora_amoeboformis.AAC.1